MRLDEIKAQASVIPWFHSIELTPGFTTSGTKSVAQLSHEEEAILGRLNLSDASLIEIGTWNGYFAFAAKRRGASRVIATDKFVWHATNGLARQAFDLAHKCLGEGVEVLEIDPTEFPGPLSPADVMLFSGVFYHLWDPLVVLQKISPLTKDVLIVETHMDGCQLTQPAMIHYVSDELGNDPTNWWGPNIACVWALLTEVGFGGKIVFQGDVQNAVRGVFHAFRDDAAFERRFSGTLDNETILFDLSNKAVREHVISTAARHMQNRVT
jgi:tRNA (mo5U34)-methyltransferase